MVAKPASCAPVKHSRAVSSEDARTYGTQWYIFRHFKFFASPLFAMKKTFSFRPRSEVFEQYKGVEGHFGHICYTHILYISASHATPRGTLLTIARRTARFRRPVLHVQVGNRREKTFGQQAGLLRACESHAVRSAKTQECTRTLHRGEHAHCMRTTYTLCAYQPSSLICHTLLFAASSLRRSLQGKTRDVGLCAEPSGNRRRTTGAAASGANGCLCEALGRQARVSSDFCAVLLKNTTAGLATALRGDRRLCR